VVLLITDGLERDDTAGLAAETERLHKSCRRLIWLNPLLRFDGFEARARGVRLHRVICDKYVTIEDGTVIGEDRAVDAERFHISPGGVVVIPKGAIVPREGPLLFSSSLPPPGSIQPRHHEPGSVKITPESTESETT